MSGDLIITPAGAYDDDGPLMPADAAGLLLTWLEAQGAVLELNASDHVETNLDPMDDMTYEKANAIAEAVLFLGDEIRRILRARRRVH